MVIESDDWGAIRTPSLDVIKQLRRSDFDIDHSHYIHNDSLASEKDLALLFRVLKSVKDSNGRRPVFTANTILANPDFNKIKNSGLTEYHFEWFTESLKRYPQHQNSFELWLKGYNDGVFFPQLHGREHLQVQRWMRDLQFGNPATLKAFKNGYYGLGPLNSTNIELSYLPAFDFGQKEELKFIAESICEASSKFKELFGYTSISSVAPNYVWNFDIEKIFYSCGIRYIQSGRAQILPKIDRSKKRYIRHYIGERNSLNQIYLIRNCSFEPSSDRNIDWVDKCMKEIRTSFLWKKPAIIESHRVNYIGYLNEENRDRSLKLLNKLLNKVVEEWPEIEFMTSDQLGDFISET